MVREGGLGVKWGWGLVLREDDGSWGKIFLENEHLVGHNYLFMFVKGLQTVLSVLSYFCQAPI